MPKIKQLSVMMENKPGALASLTQLIADSKLNLEGLMVAEAIGEGFVRLIADDPGKLAKVLKKKGLRFVTDEVIGIDLSNKAGALATAAQKLGAAGINIQYAYATGMANSKKVMAIVKVPDPQKALKLLK
ncbi:MAG: ACT domain-containing protein [Acidobacteriota bacterium]